MWTRIKRARAHRAMPSTMSRDLRAKAFADKAARDGVRMTSDLGIHATESQTTACIRRNKAPKSSAAA